MALKPLAALPEHDLHIKRALLSVSDKTGIVELAQALYDAGVELLSTGGTANSIKQAGIPVKDVSEITGFPECLDGRVKTLHPMVHGGILARTSHQPDLDELTSLGISPIELVVVNLYPFKQTIEKPDTTLATAVEFIDIGGPTMVRASAKNFAHVSILTNPEQYASFIAELKERGSISYATRLELGRAAFNHTASYDSDIANYLNALKSKEETPDAIYVHGEKAHDLRYGENPHQKAGIYGNPGKYIDCFHGKELSYNNYLDVDAALRLIADFEQAEPTVAIFKHTVPCGVGTGNDLLTAWNRAFAADKVSPFGGIVISNRMLDLETAKAIDSIFTEIIIAPSYSDDALELLKKKANRRLITQLKSLKDDKTVQVKSILGGYLYQQADALSINMDEIKVVSNRKPTDAELADLIFSWKVCKHVKSNAIVYAKDGMTLGIGTGQTSRVDASEQAITKAGKEGHDLKGSVIASDAFFPFADGVEAAAKAGVTAVIQPGGSVRDNEVIEMANTYNLAMIFTGIRHFRH
ncbi:bifunctional phosphoribosylaminoimidazolecarboxamide formyltransferase/IMP cyclohydrolase [bacterium]|nr:MAG: bifunctional phosphoribosylaminoimidazolecarboxamide formyltransferase/IMP cyclohydrolase [bacterium]